MNKKNKSKKKNMRGYVTLIVVLVFIPFLLVQGINLVDMSIDVVHVSSNSVASNRQYIDEQTCWEEILYFFRNNNGMSYEKSIDFSYTTCDFNVQEIEEHSYKITLESSREGYYSSSERYVFYDGEVMRFLTLQQELN